MAAAKAFFGDQGRRVAQRALLLTATPSHTRLGDVVSILGYFIEMDEDARNQPVDALMQKYALRRFRLMAGKGVSYTKHQYRREIATPCEFAGHPEAEMFFALYQQRLVCDLNVRDEKRRILYGFLEGFESAGPDDRPSAAQNVNDEQAHVEHAKDFYAADDTQLLYDMSQDYRRIFGSAPEHPKYGQVVEQCAPEGLFPMPVNRPLHEDKHLVFVRRIPSVHELTKRINEHYDQIFATEICAAWDLDADDPRFKHWKSKRWARDVFNELIAADTSSIPDTDDDEPTDDPDEQQDSPDSYHGSNIADLFVTKKAVGGNAAPRPTDCSRFSLNLRRTTSIDAMFMEPASDYVTAGYDWHYQFRQGDKQRSDYTKAAQMHRMETRDAFPMEKVEAMVRPPRDATRQNYDAPIETLWSLVFPLLDERLQATLRRWADECPKVAENFGNYIKAGFLFASPVVVELYGWHTKFRKLSPSGQYANVQQRYQNFVAYARERIANSLLLRYFAAALDSFEQLCDKIIDHDASDWIKGWRTLTTLSNPAWYASGESSHRQHLILGFNSPFYPNTLVATSVFQEGVNLHLQCRMVHHYGIAWTPGDNEQRVGRIDRLFGKVNHLLREYAPGTATLDINYPYLKNSFDEDQVGSFIERKYGVEEKMDRCAQGSFDKVVHLTRPGWQEFLRKPVAKSMLQDPYPARFGDEDVPKAPYRGAG